MSYQNRSMPDHNLWPAFTMPWDDNTSGPADVSHLLHQPAGKHGFVRVQDGHLATDAGRFRIWGNNITAGGCIPPKEMAPVIARRCAKLGINCLRFHFLDSRFPHGIIARRTDVPIDETPRRGLPRSTESTRAFEPEGVDRFDYLVYCLKENGVYMDLNLNVGRMFTEADGLEQAALTGFAKSLTYFHPALVELQKEYAQQLLQHVNPYTGVAYTDEPAVALVELVNENSIVEAWLLGRLKGEQTEPFGTWGDIPSMHYARLNKLWNEHLVATYRTRQALADAWDGDLDAEEDPATGTVRRLRPEQFAKASRARFAAEASFYADMERDWFAMMGSYLKNDLGVKSPVLGSSDHNHGINNAIHVYNNTALDVIDAHCYWQHPRYGDGGYSTSNWMITNTAMVDAPDHSAVAQLSRSRVEGMPFTLSEINEPFPNDYACEYWPTIAAYASLQDWDGIFFYNYVGGPTVKDWAEPRMGSFFFTAHEPVKMAQTAAGALMFLRGDVAPALENVPRRVNRDWLIDALQRHPDDEHPYTLPWLKGRLALIHRTGTESFRADEIAPAQGAVSLPEDGDIISDTGELTWRDTGCEQTNQVLINTPRAQAVIGWAGPAETDHLGVAMDTPFSAVQLVSTGDAPIAAAERMLLVAGARTANTGMAWQDSSRTTFGDAWGDAPMRIEPVTGKLALRGLKGATQVMLQPLDGCGQPACPPKEFNRQGDSWTILLTDDPATVWYSVNVLRGDAR